MRPLSKPIFRNEACRAREASTPTVFSGGDSPWTAPFSSTLCFSSFKGWRIATRGICFSPALRFTAVLLVVSLVCQPVLRPASEPQRARITGIAGVTILATSVSASLQVYEHMLEPGFDCPLCEDRPDPRLELGNGQFIALGAARDKSPQQLLGEVVFFVSDLDQMADYLKSKNVLFDEVKEARAPRRLRLLDPEGNRISFVDSAAKPAARRALPKPPFHLIHSGFIVRNRAATEHFYKDILGFRPYWHGGMKDDVTDWISLQVPDGTDWVELMVNVDKNADQRLRGIMNHIALGVPDIHAAQQQLVKNGVKLTEQPKIGRDGKWQLNLYDPDLTRIELMEFAPVEKPCCSEFTGPHPKP